VHFHATEIDGNYVVELECFTDERGFFARTYCASEFAELGLESMTAQSSVSFNKSAGTLRGLHFQEEPHGEAKLVRVTQGAIFDVCLDLRVDSPTYRKWSGVELSAKNRKSFYIPQGCAHGFITVVDETEVSYQISQEYESAAASGVRWDDPAFDIQWPRSVAVISDRDRNFSLVD
jgi:dTDP-4-dehydrorhamnose 3,5-epimerase